MAYCYYLKREKKILKSQKNALLFFLNTDNIGFVCLNIKDFSTN